MDTPLDQPVDPIRPQPASEDKETEPPYGAELGSHPPPPQESRKERKECRPDQTPWWKHLLELAAVLLGIAVAYIYWNQLAVMAGQLKQMTDSGKQTDQLICLYQKQLIELQRQSERIGGQLSVMQQGYELQRIEAKLTWAPFVKLNHWMALYDLGPRSKQIRIDLKIVNTGKSKARFVAVASTIEFRNSDPEQSRYSFDNFKPADPKEIAPTIDQPEVPNTEATFVKEYKRVSANEYASYKAGDTRLYIWGRVRYGDDFTKEVTTTKGFCRYLSAKDVLVAGPYPNGYGETYHDCERNPPPS